MTPSNEREIVRLQGERNLAEALLADAVAQLKQERSKKAALVEELAWAVRSLYRNDVTSEERDAELRRAAVEALARLVVSYADATHEAVIAGDLEVVKSSWQALVAKCRAALIAPETPKEKK